jgi:hypothetical protein
MRRDLEIKTRETGFERFLRQRQKQNPKEDLKPLVEGVRYGLDRVFTYTGMKATYRFFLTLYTLSNAFLRRKWSDYDSED